MIPRDFITEWRAHAPWASDRQVEQDLVISRALVELFAHDTLAGALAFRGGTALYKLHLRPAVRYSEDIDLVQTASGPIGTVLDAIRAVLDGWLGPPQRKHSDGRVTLLYRFRSEDLPPVPMRLKIEINSREHFTMYGYHTPRFDVSSPWFRGTATIRTYELDELLGTKLRALYQRKKGRDLFDLARGLQHPDVTPARIVDAFMGYMERDGHRVTRALFERNLAEKRAAQVFLTDMAPLLPPGYEWDVHDAFRQVSETLITRLPGETWRGAS